MIKLLELFGGIGACSKALDRLAIDYEIADYVEIDKYAVQSYNAIHNTHFLPQDICKWDKNIDVDLIMHGSPCQDFSLAGKQAGGDEGSGTRSSLMYETIRIVEKLKPSYVIWENVRNVISKKHMHNFDNYIRKMDEIGYYSYYEVLNSKDYGIPQNRERVFTVSIRKDIDIFYKFPPKEELKVKLKDLLEENVDEKYYLSDKLVDNLKLDNQSIANDFIPIKNDTQKGYLGAYEGDGIDISSRMQYHRGTVQKEMIQTLDTQASKGVVVNKTICLNSKGGRNGIEGLQPSRSDRIYDINGIAGTVATTDFYNPTYKTELCIRKLTPKECWRLMGFDDEDYEKASKVNSNTQLYKQAGNSIVVNVLEAILTNLLIEKNQGFRQTTIFDYL